VKISDFIFRFPTQGFTRHDAICRVRLFITSEKSIYVVLTDLGEKNTGSSVTNSVEKIRSELIHRGHINEDAKIIEHYDKNYPIGGSFDFLTFNEHNRPTWQSAQISSVCNLLDTEHSEFLVHSLEIPRLFDAIEKIRHDINPFVDAPWPESYEVINRREDIQIRWLPEGKLTEAIENNSSETDIQALLSSDLSIIGDFYSYPSEEYICFSQFPVGDGFVDFVIFSGRSRMDVTLIEIKGANYNLINGNNYEDFSAKSNQAVQQIRKRLGYISRNPEEFRKFVHQVRHDVESGETKYNSFIGPKGKLEVDANKDIKLHTVVIGGRSKNDIKESRLRHEYEMRTSPSMKIESWDSWLKKSNRR
jgi:hypothetical protein